MVADPLEGDRLVPGHQECAGAFPEPRVGHCHHGDLQHGRVPDQQQLDFLRIDLLPAAVDDVLDAAVDGEVAGVVHGAHAGQVAGAEETRQR